MTRQHLSVYTVTIQFNQLDEGFFLLTFFIYYSIIEPNN